MLAAYKDILAPWKELLTWYSTKEDVRIKYEQIVSQFEPPGLVESSLMEKPPERVVPLAGEIAASALTYAEEDGANRVERVSFAIPAGQHAALVGRGHSGKDDLTHLLARLVFPSGGRIAVAGNNFAEVHQAVPGRRIAYATQNAYIFSGPLSYNLYYGLMHQPLRPATYDEAGAKREQTRVRDALIAGNSPDDVRADWIDYEAAGVADAAELTEVALTVLRRVEMEQEVIGFGLASAADPQAQPSLAAMGLEARARIRARVQGEDLTAFVELFDPSRYHSNISVAENLLFGTPRSPAFQPANLPGNPEFVALLREVGLLDDLYAAGVKVAGLMVELFADVAPDSDLFSQYSFISADDLPEFRVLLTKIADGTLAATTDEERASLLALTFRLVAAQHRVGVIDDEMQRKVVEARAEFRRRYAGREDVVEFFEADRFSSTLSIQDNILFGRVALEHANAQGRGERPRARSRGRGRDERRARAARPRIRGRQRRIAALLFAAAAPRHRARHHEESGHPRVQRADLRPRSRDRDARAECRAGVGQRAHGDLGSRARRSRAGVRPRAGSRRRPAGRAGILRGTRASGYAPVAASRLTPPMSRLGCSRSCVTSRLIAIVCLALANVGLATVYEASPNDYRQSIKRLRAGDTLLLAAGEYQEGLQVHGLSGAADRPIVISGPAQERPATFVAQAGRNTVSIVDSSFVLIRNLVLEGTTFPSMA